MIQSNNLTFKPNDKLSYTVGRQLSEPAGTRAVQKTETFG